MKSKNNQNTIIRLYLNLIEERTLLLFAFLSSIIKLFCLQSVKEEMLKAEMVYSEEIANETCECYYKEFTQTASHQDAKTRCKLETKQNLNLNRKI